VEGQILPTPEYRKKSEFSVTSEPHLGILRRMAWHPISRLYATRPMYRRGSI
jgi:hypothetical protein